MTRYLSIRRSIVALAGLAVPAIAIVASSAAPAGAESFATSTCPAGPPVLELAVNPGDLLTQGDHIFSGDAFDPASTDGPGISRVDLFLGERETGGMFLGSVTPGQHLEPSTNPRAFDVKVTVPSTLSGVHEFVGYAYSATSGEETTVSVPVYVGAAPTPTPSSGTNNNTTPTPTPLMATTESSCKAPSAVASTAAGAATTAFAPIPLSGSHVAPYLQLANPSSGDVLPIGDVIFEGVAYDPNAGQADGIDRVSLFLDSRDSGGLIVGSGAPNANHVFHIKATLPASATGTHTFFAYAHSSVTDQESATSVPVYVGAAPTPTPRPKPNS